MLFRPQVVWAAVPSIIWWMSGEVYLGPEDLQHLAHPCVGHRSQGHQPFHRRSLSICLLPLLQE